MSISGDLCDKPGDRPTGVESASGPLIVTRYRCYLMDMRGDFLDVVNVECERDDLAVREALKAQKRVKTCHGLQVWRGDRMVYQQGKAKLIEN